MTESTVLFVECPKCGRPAYPFGKVSKAVPTFKSKVECEHCGLVIENVAWYDSETTKTLLQNGRGLIQSEGLGTMVSFLEKRLEVLQESRDADRKEIELIRQLLSDIGNNRLTKLTEEASERDQEIANLAARIKSLEDWKDLTEDMK